MAEAVVTNFAKDLHGTLERLIFYSYSSKIDISAELKEVDRCILAIINKLPHIEKNQSSSPMARIWLGKVTNAVLEADEMCDEIAYKKLFEDLVSPRIKFLEKVRHLFSSSHVHSIVIDLSMECSISKIKQSLKDSCERIKELKIDVEQKMGKQSMSFLPDKGVFGRDELKSQIVKELLDESNSVIAIVGLVGMGKTTLAQYVFNDTKVKNHFLDRRWWVCIANQGTIDTILMKITDAATNGKASSSQSQLGSLPLKETENQKYLLVLEDYTFGNFHIWNQLRGLLHKGAKGNKILLTTRPEEAAKTTRDISKTFELTGLSDEGCLSLFNRTAFGTLQTSKEQEHIGVNLVSKCRNVPLLVNSAAKIFLEVKEKENEWLKFKDENLDIMNMCFHYKEGALLNVLRLNYDELEPHLKHCFAYCSLFPKGYEYDKHDLIRLWMAQGFIKSSNTNFSLEDDGEEHFRDLHRMWFFQDAKCDAFGEVTSCKMHDMLHHLARCLAGSRSVMAFSGFGEIDDRTLHVSARVDGSFSEALFQAYKLRSLLLMKDPFFEGKLDRSTICMLISKLKCLRTLDLHDCDIDILPNEVGDLIHLRYLDLSKNYSLITLPNSITKLYHLQTMKLNFCQKLKRLPKGIGKLVMLRCLEIDECDNLSYMPLGLEKLSHLQTLNRFVVCLPSFDDNTSGGIKVLNKLDDLRGKLKIELSGQWKDLVDEAPQANLKDKRRLTDLKIEWRLRELDGSHDCYSYATLLEGFEPPCSLRALNIEGYRGKDFPSWARMDKLAKSLPKLVTIGIEGCKGCKHLPPFGQLELLKFLTLRHMEGVEYVENGTICHSSSFTSFFPSLEELTLHSFYNLKRWWKDVGELKNIGDFPSFPRLQKLKILNCPKLVSVPRFNNVEDIHFENVNEKVLEVLVLEPVSNLKRFHIKTFPYMKIFPTLNIKDRCSIQNLIIDKCDTLTSINGCEQLTSLVSLEISNCKVLSFGDFPWRSLSNLRFLVFQGIPKMKSLPLGLQRINNLQSLSVVGCSALTTIPEWIDQIVSLQHLKIEACPKLTSLPLNIRYVKLDVLEILECPELIESCREPNGKCWHNIKHIHEVSCHKSWRYGLMNDAMRTRILEPKQSLSFKDRYNNQ